MSNARSTTGSIAFGLLLALAACSGAPPPPSQPSPLLKRTMPTFEGDTLTRGHFYTAQGNGYPMVVKFFSSKCEACKQTLAAVQSVYADSTDLVVVGVSEDDSAVDARRTADGLGLHFPIILDEGGSVMKQYQVTAVPATFVITRNGNVSWVGGKEQTEAGIRAAVRAARD